MLVTIEEIIETITNRFEDSMLDNGDKNDDSSVGINHQSLKRSRDPDLEQGSDGTDGVKKPRVTRTLATEPLSDVSLPITATANTRKKLLDMIDGLHCEITQLPDASLVEERMHHLQRKLEESEACAVELINTKGALEEALTAAGVENEQLQQANATLSKQLSLLNSVREPSSIEMELARVGSEHRKEINDLKTEHKKQIQERTARIADTEKARTSVVEEKKQLEKRIKELGQRNKNLARAFQESRRVSVPEATISAQGQMVTPEKPEAVQTQHHNQHEPLKAGLIDQTSHDHQAARDTATSPTGQEANVPATRILIKCEECIDKRLMCDNHPVCGSCHIARRTCIRTKCIAFRTPAGCHQPFCCKVHDEVGYASPPVVAQDNGVASQAVDVPVGPRRPLLCFACFKQGSECDNRKKCGSCQRLGIACVRSLCQRFRLEGECHEGGCRAIHDEGGYETTYDQFPQRRR